MFTKITSYVFIITLCLWLNVSIGSSFEMMGFMDATYKQSFSENADQSLKNGSFNLGQLDYFTSQRVTTRLDVLSELVFEPSGGSTVVDLERVEVGYDLTDWFNFRIGRFHNTLGYYASNFHHGRYLDSTISRPLILEFEDEGGLIPAHMVGAIGKINKDFRLGRIKLKIGLVNGIKLNIDNKELVLNLDSDDNSDKGKIFTLEFHPAAVEGLGFGTSVHSSKVDGFSLLGGTTPVVSVSQQILAFNINYDLLPFQLLAEYYIINDKDLKSITAKDYQVNAYFIQAAYEFKEKYRPYLRFEELKPEKSDPYAENLSGTTSVQRLAYGFRFNLDSASCMKLEGISEQKASKEVITYAFQWAYSF